MPSFIRKSNRLKDYDYSQSGAYFITICTLNKQKILWEDNGWRPTNQEDLPPLSRIGMCVNDAIRNIPRFYPNVTIEKHSVLPNHLHKIFQKSFHDRIIRNDQEAQNIEAYIDANPMNWETDPELFGLL